MRTPSPVFSSSGTRQGIHFRVEGYSIKRTRTQAKGLGPIRDAFPREGTCLRRRNSFREAVSVKGAIAAPCIVVGRTFTWLIAVPARAICASSPAWVGHLGICPNFRREPTYAARVTGQADVPSQGRLRVRVPAMAMRRRRADFWVRPWPTPFSLYRAGKGNCEVGPAVKGQTTCFPMARRNFRRSRGAITKAGSMPLSRYVSPEPYGRRIGTRGRSRTPRL